MKNLLVAAFTEAGAEVGEGGAAGDGIKKSGKVPIGLTLLGIAQDGEEMVDVGDFVEIAEQVEKKEGDGIVARTSENGVGIGGDGANEGKIDKGSGQLREAATDGSILVDMGKLGAERGEPAGFFIGKLSQRRGGARVLRGRGE